MEEIDWSSQWWRSPGLGPGRLGPGHGRLRAAGLLLIKRTGWGRQFWRLSSMYFIPFSRSWQGLRPILTVALLLLLTVMSVRLDVLLSFQGNELFTALQERPAQLALDRRLRRAGHGQRAAGADHLLYRPGPAHQLAVVAEPADGGRLDDRRCYHRGRFVTAPVDNPDQRIQADITRTPRSPRAWRWAWCRRWSRWCRSP